MNTMETAPLLLQSFPSYCTSGLAGFTSEELTKNKVILGLFIRNPKVQFHRYLENYLKIKLWRTDILIDDFVKTFPLRVAEQMFKTEQ